MNKWMCFECGKQIHAPLQKFVTQDVYPPYEGADTKITIYAHAKCIEDSPNKWPNKNALGNQRRV